MKRSFVALVCLIFCAGVSVAQKGTAEPDDKTANIQTFKYVEKGVGAVVLARSGRSVGIQKRPSPPAANVISDLTEFMGRSITVYYTTQEHTVGGEKEKYNDLWRIRILTAKKK